MNYYYDSSYILVLIGFVLCLLASANVKSTFNRYSKIANRRGLTGAQVAEKILHDAGIYDVMIQRIGGELTDHYSPSEKVLRLSDVVYDSPSVAAIGVAAHECGHAIQHQQSYSPLSIRSAVIPFANIGSKISYPMIFAGLFFGWVVLAKFGVALFSLIVLAQLVTLPVEFNASNRALKILGGANLLDADELGGAKSVLFSAALTYVAAVASSLLQLIRLMRLTRRR